MKKNWILLILMFVFCQTNYAQITGNMTDPRDGQTYQTIDFENPLVGSSITWMAENLNYKTEGTFAYDSIEKFRNGVGLLYTWEAANQACPTGWHLPSDLEWDLLVNQFGGRKKAGATLKNDKGWNNGGNGTNPNGFNTLPGGFRHPKGNFAKLGDYGYWWSSTSVTKETALMREMYQGSSKVGRDADYKSSAFSCRCVQD